MIPSAPLHHSDALNILSNRIDVKRLTCFLTDNKGSYKSLNGKYFRYETNESNDVGINEWHMPRSTIPLFSFLMVIIFYYGWSRACEKKVERDFNDYQNV